MTKWDPYSDQPMQLVDKKLKLHLRLGNKFDLLINVFTIIALTPLIAIKFCFTKTLKRQDQLQDFFGLGVNLDKDTELESSKNLINELQVKHLLIRIPLNDIDNIQAYKNFAAQFQDCQIVFNLMQDRNIITNQNKAKQALDLAFSELQDLSCYFQVGNAINRIKWGVIHSVEYLRFYQIAFDLRNEKYQNIKLLAAPVIDFEFYHYLRYLYSLKLFKIDFVASLLYVDRRAAPENKQGFFDFKAKIKLLQAIISLSPKVQDRRFYITESNYPLINTGKYAPAAPAVQVDELSYSKFMLRYYLLALSEGVVQAVFWHQLIAAGYGLVDNRHGLRKRPAFTVFKVMIAMLQNTKFESFKQNNSFYELSFSDQKQQIKVVWDTKIVLSKCIDNVQVFNSFGNKQEFLRIDDEPKYILSHS